MSDDQTTIKPDAYAAWRYPAFRCYAASWFLVMFSKMIETVVVGAYILEKTNGNALYLAWIGLVQAGPVLLFAIPGGQIADRFNRRNVIICMLGLSICAAIGMLMLAIFQWPIEWIYVFLGIGAVGQSLGGPSRSSLLPQIIPAKKFNNAVTWNSSVFQMSMMLGPAVGGLISGAKNEHIVAAFATVLVCRILSFISMLFMENPGERDKTESISLESLMAGIRFVRRAKLILATITMDLFAVLFGGLTYLLPVFASEEYLNVGTTGQGFLRSAEAIGAISMGLLIAHLPPMKRAGWTLLWAVAGFGAATIVFGLSKWFWLSLVMMFVIGALDNISVVVRHTLVQMLTPDPMRGRVSAVNNVFIVASNDIGGFESGLTARLFGPVASVVFGGTCTILVVLASARIWPEILTIGSLYDVRPTEVELAEAAAAEKSAMEETAERS
jgi:MFS family permease